MGFFSGGQTTTLLIFGWFLAKKSTCCVLSIWFVISVLGNCLGVNSYTFVFAPCLQRPLEFEEVQPPLTHPPFERLLSWMPSHWRALGYLRFCHVSTTEKNCYPNGIWTNWTICHLASLGQLEHQWRCLAGRPLRGLFGQEKWGSTENGWRWRVFVLDSADPSFFFLCPSADEKDTNMFLLHEKTLAFPGARLASSRGPPKEWQKLPR